MAQGPGAALHGVEVVVLEPGPDRELEERAPRGDERAHRLVALLHAQIARVHAAGLHGHERLGEEPVVLVERLEGGLLPGLVAVEGEDHLAARAVVGDQAAGHLDVVRAERGAARGHRRPDAGQVGRHHVRVALDEHQLALLGDRPLGQVDAVEHLRLLVERRLGGVEVLGPGVVVVQLARAEADGRAGHVPDGPEQAAAEPVVQAALPLGHQTGGAQLLVPEPLLPQVVQQMRPPLRGVSEAELRRVLLCESPLGEEVAGGLRLGRAEGTTEELVRHLVRLEQTTTAPRLRLVRAGAAVLVVQLHPHPGRQSLHGLHERGVFKFHEEADDVPVRAASEAVIGAHAGAHVERRRPLVVERAQPLE